LTKEFISPGQLVGDSFRLARRVYDSGFRPGVLLALWRGGSPVGIVVHEFFLFHGIDAYHTTIKVDSYDGVGRRREPQLERFDHVVGRITPGTRVLVVDDIYDSGKTMRAVCGELGVHTPHIKTATVYCKSGHAAGGTGPDYFVRATDHWLVFPHELVGLTPEEIRQKSDYLGGAV
jgi:hypoxanthine phosphoribosyltransferase